jgi:hypothetical protein
LGFEAILPNKKFPSIHLNYSTTLSRVYMYRHNDKYSRITVAPWEQKTISSYCLNSPIQKYELKQLTVSFPVAVKDKTIRTLVAAPNSCYLPSGVDSDVETL